MTDDPLAGEPFTTADTRALITLYQAATPPNTLRRTPWTWAALKKDQAAVLARVVREWVHFYNRVHAVTVKELIPPCWPLHPGLAHELAVLVWAYYHAHHDPKATPLIAVDYHARYLASFRTRLDHMLGRDPHSCRAGEHTATWRTTVDEQLSEYSPTDLSETQSLISQHFGFA
ncbi:hypothetical protein Lesp02_03230 [Lentzea sp. NBRC 105346]|uniref:hypothetical protein n=1 Tax=Lentzea sp. NBRC 105346 TaxID=3032205 RepID=UPI0024A3BFC7|nr:hypothetical protein [Lentzea sp. NBRC 105346]GLZ28133.1 hypothetical protein Lesp02_03230 [Lentzea sp. NBRC 105346]